MPEIYRSLLILICMSLLVWGLIRIERIYQYPFFMGAIFVSFLIPQTASLIANPGLLNQDALARVLLMSCLCAIACWIGYQGKPNQKFINHFNINLNETKLFQIALILTFLGYFFNYLIDQSDIQRSDTNGNWTGEATIYYFFAQVIYIAFSVFLLRAIRYPSMLNIILASTAGWIPLQTVLGGRRQPTMTFVIIVGLSFWLVRRYLPPRWLIILTIFLMSLLLLAIGELRGLFWELLFSGKWNAILSTIQEQLAIQQTGEILELKNAAYYIDAVTALNLYGLGSGWWDSVVFQYVPGQLLGFGLKVSLQFNLITNETLYNLYGYSVHVGTTTTGVGDSFMEFGYLGCLSFALIGYLFKNLWISAYYNKSFCSSILYMGLVSPAMLALTHGIGRFLQEAIFQISIVFLIVLYSKQESKNNRYLTPGY
ncbi:MAG: hypothetical protein VKJ02_09355 [Snowella sp.]|nr:hypothetical protein [Snowella sp.]